MTKAVGAAHCPVVIQKAHNDLGFMETGSHCNPGWPQIHSVVEDDLEHRTLPPPFPNAEFSGVSHHAWYLLAFILAMVYIFLFFFPFDTLLLIMHSGAGGAGRFMCASTGSLHSQKRTLGWMELELPAAMSSLISVPRTKFR